jgi:serine/threonine-protein kinase HipA
MRAALVKNHGKPAGVLEETERGYRFAYSSDYIGDPVSLTMPVIRTAYDFDSFPPFFDGLLPEGFQLESLLQQTKLDADDYLGQLLAVGLDCVGSVTVHPL